MSSPCTSGILSSADPAHNIHDRQIVRERHGQLIDCRRLLTAGDKLRKISAHRRRAIEDL
jgi:hypothetical protein